MRRGRFEDDENRIDNPRYKAGLLSILTFWYTRVIFRMGKQADFTEEDLMKPLPSHKSSKLGDRISRLWSKEVYRSRIDCDSPSLTKVIFQCFYKECLVYGFALFFMEVVIRLHQPLLIGLLIQYFDPNNKLNTNPEKPPRYLMRVFNYWVKDQCAINSDEAAIYGAGVFFCSAVVTLVLHPTLMGVTHVGMKVRVACCSLIYRKVLRLNLTSLGDKAVGTAVNLVSNDVNRFDMAPLFFHYIWISPVQCSIALYLLYKEIQMAAFVGMISILIFIPIQGWLATLTSVLRNKTAERTDERVREMNEIIRGIQVIKMYAWEYAFIEKINKSRERELTILKYMSYIRGTLMSFIMFTTRLGIFLSVVAYILMNNHITAENVFVVTGYYLILRQTMTVYFPQGIVMIAEASVAVRRINTFLVAPESDVGDPTPIDPTTKKRSSKKIFTHELHVMIKKLGMPLGVIIDNASTKFGDVVCLENITLTAIPEQITMVIGSVGSGKSCLLNLILGELIPFSGQVQCYGTISYACQEPWLFASSVRDNILFGQEYNRTRYRDVVKVCALARDFTLFPYGDRTIVGERGVSLSGGQRARINLARAVYKEADIYLLDDPLSAVDPHVGQHLFDECISRYLSSKVVVLVTHQLQYLKNAHQIVVLDKGKILMKGSYQKLKESGLDIVNLIETSSPDENNKPIDKPQNALNQISVHSNMGLLSDSKKDPEEVGEIRTTGAIKTDTYIQYFRAGGNCLTNLIMLLLFLSAQVFASLTDYFLAYWIKLYHNYEKTPEKFARFISIDEFVEMYTCLIAGITILALARSFYFFSLTVRSSYNLHNRMFISVIKATMSFFHANPSGRILNRFSKDLGAVDEFLPNAMIDTIQIFLNVVGAAVVLAGVNVMLLLPTFIVCLCCSHLRSYYVKTSRSVKRLEGITKSPMFSHFNATMQGLSTIRSHHNEVLLTNEFDKYQDVHSSSWYLFICTSRAFGYWLDCICIVYIGAIIFVSLFMANNLYSSDVGLCITQCIGLTGLFQWGMRQSAELENQMTSVERVLEFTTIENEPPLESSNIDKPPTTWPPKGEIVFKKLNMRYNIKQPPVLKNLSITIKPQEKVGIVGRTGAGKSSLISALFRLAYLDGELIIDNINAIQIGLHDLRKKISIIPQEPVLFSGTLRYNLDPFKEFPDYMLVESLETVELKSALGEGTACLDTVISEGGSNISVGHRQLICLSRAILRNNKILVLDEATANVDALTDSFIQTTIRTKFAKCTVLTIAHRLNTIIDSDKVLVIDAGTVAEFDHPHSLLINKNGIFSSMVHKLGPDIEIQLKEIAKESFQKKPKASTSADLKSLISTMTTASHVVKVDVATQTEAPKKKTESKTVIKQVKKP